MIQYEAKQKKKNFIVMIFSSLIQVCWFPNYPSCQLFSINIPYWKNTWNILLFFCNLTEFVQYIMAKKGNLVEMLCCGSFPAQFNEHVKFEKKAAYNDSALNFWSCYSFWYFIVSKAFIFFKFANQFIDLNLVTNSKHILQIQHLLIFKS